MPRDGRLRAGQVLASIERPGAGEVLGGTFVAIGWSDGGVDVAAVDSLPDEVVAAVLRTMADHVLAHPGGQS